MGMSRDWLVEHRKSEWSKFYRSRFSDFRLLNEEKARIALTEEIGTDGRDLLEKVYTSTSHSWLYEASPTSFNKGYRNRILPEPLKIS